MAHRTEKEETTDFKTKVHDTTTPTPTLQTMCQNCNKTSPPPFSHQPHKNKRDTSTRQEDEEDEYNTAEPIQMPMKKVVNRCFGCRRKVGLTGFRCRCGELFCGEHRYSDRHVCSFDYKSAGREEIKRQNPVVKAPKILRV